MDGDAFRTPAWLLVGLTQSIPGMLELADGHFAFTTEEKRVFDVPLPQVSEALSLGLRPSATDSLSFARTMPVTSLGDSRPERTAVDQPRS